MKLSTDPSKPGYKVKEPVIALLKAAAELAMLNGAGTVSNLLDAAGALGRDELDSSQQANRFWRAVLAHAVMDLIVRYKAANPANEIERIAARVGEFGPFFDESVEYDVHSLENPTSFIEYQRVRSNIWEVLIALKPAALPEKAEVELYLDQALYASISKVWSDDRSTVFRETVHSILSGPVFVGAERRQAWQRHYNWIDSRLSKRELFGQEGKGITLRDVYVPLRTLYFTIVNEATISPETKKAAQSPRLARQLTTSPTVGWLAESLSNWLSSLSEPRGRPDLTDNIRVVFGAPGSGKSVFSKTFAFDVAMKRRWNVAYVELQHMSYKGDIRDRIREYFKAVEDGAGLGSDIFELMEGANNLPTFFVFDGLDELSRTEDMAVEVSRKFIREVKDFLSTANRSGLRSAAVILGRAGAVQRAVEEADLRPSVLLEVLPLAPIDDSDDSENEDADSSAEVPVQKLDQRITFWNKWLSANNVNSSGYPTFLNNKNLSDLTSEPLLFYLLILSGYTESPGDEQLLSRNKVYFEIFRRVHWRDRDKDIPHPSARRTDEDTFFHLMECLGLAIWQGGGRTGSKADFDKFKIWHAYEKLDDFQQEEFAQLNNVALQFYTRALDEAQKGFEFVHKSFGEYLAARAICRAATEFAGTDRRQLDFCQHWLEMFGAQPVTGEILQFMQHEFLLHEVSSNEKLLKSLLRNMNWALEHGFPSNKDSYPSWRVAETHQRNAMGTLLSVLSALSDAVFAQNATPSLAGNLKLQWSPSLPPRYLIETLRITGDKDSVNPRLLRHLDLRCGLESDPGLSAMNFTSVDLSYADLSETIANDSDFFLSTLVGANFRNARLMDCDFTNTACVDADFSFANLRRSKFDMCDIRGVSMHRANLLSATFSHTNVEGADFRLANVSAADLSDAYNLKFEQIEGAFGDSATLLPEGMATPDHWLKARYLETDLRNQIWARWADSVQ